MKKALATFALTIALATAAFAYQSFTCPSHPFGQCTTDGQVKHDAYGRTWEHYRCTCGDSGWVQQ